jgi:hypothetical protein
MTDATPILLVALLAGCFTAAGWPLLILPRVRRVLAGASGSCFMALGVAITGGVTSGLVQIPHVAASLRAADTSPAVKQSSTPEKTSSGSEKSAAADSGSASNSPETPAAPKPNDSPASDPQIEAAAQDTVVIPPGRPEWVEKEPNTSGKIHTLAVSSGPFKRESDCNRALGQELVKAMSAYIADQLHSELAPKFIGYDARAIKERFVKPANIYHEVITVSVGDMHQVHALIELGPEFRGELENRWDKVRATSRLFQMGLFSGAGLLLIASVFSYFRLDNATRGYYTGRLQFMTTAAILAIVGAGTILAQWITWL